MWIKEINLKNYRNYNSIETNFSPKLNIFVGQNAQGKTNFLEAIYFLSLTRSHRTRSDKELIKFGEKELMVSGVINRVNGKIPLEINLSDKGRTTKVNHLKQSKLSDYIGTMTVVLFAPEDLQLVKGAPSLRRKFIDIDLGQIKSIYLSDLSNYNHTLKQRNTYLKTHKKIDFNFLSVLDEQLVNYGSRVIEHRLNFINDLSTEAKKHHLKISNQTETLRVSYLPSIKYDDQKNIQENFLSQLQKNHQRDIFKKSTGIGPHRDDLEFFINEINASFGSQGQHRSLILSLKLAELELIKSASGDYPILLLDDVMSELDHFRQTKLLESISENVQAFITTTSLEHLTSLPKEFQLFTIKQGQIV
ncbi:DNA replication/repair protein RecF [Streptococcus macacae]|uniref:DNA replication and repair protein RecF n=1 Tax=Streptococcus macacae NCTC 11558 TaxID=764298 RepID=G5JXJ1_9STRE|nr:DNA replication/repair protein RecF [Streptococcus macacae]EHJ53220.1 DNA replication and repair protein RecF [Streptococcus macacae NCTC 11558]SUN79765.1 recombination protein F [Streptococcus macacae NCTC 11558]